MKSSHETDNEQKHAKGQRILSSMWAFVNKTDKHGFLQKGKARLVICGNRQARLPPEVQGAISSVRKSTGPRRPFHESNYTRKHGSLDPEGGHSKV
jgi:hypothetical protein